MDLHAPGRAWPQPPYGEGSPARPGGFVHRAPAGFSAEPFVLDLEPIEEDALRQLSALRNPPGGSLPHRGRLIDIRI